MDNFMKSLDTLISIDYYGKFFESHDGTVDLYFLGPTFFGFGLLKLLDSLLEYQEYKNFSSKPLYVSSEFLDFFNMNKLSLNNLSQFYKDANDYDEKNMREFLENEEKIAQLLSAYISGFNEDILEIFNYINFNNVILNLKKHNFLSIFIKEVNDINIPKEFFISSENFIQAVNYFFNELTENTRYHLYLDYHQQDDFNLFNEKDLLRESLVKFLFTDVDLQNYDNINIYDPALDNYDTLHKSKDFIELINKSCTINLYGKINFHNSLFDATMLILDSFFKNDESIHYSLSKDYGIPFENLSEDNIDFIISDYRNKDIAEDIGFIHQFQDKLEKSSKLVMIIKKIEFNYNYINWMILNDNLEAIITFENCFILIANSNKSINRKNKFILIDNRLLSNENDYLMNINACLREYENFSDSNFSIVVKNSEVIKDESLLDEFEKYWGVYYDYDVTTIPNDVITERFNKVKVEPDAGDLGEILWSYDPCDDINYILNSFNFNNLMYDKHRKPYSLITQKYLGNKKSCIIEEKLEFIPLYSIITFNKEEIEENMRDALIIEKFDETFYVKSERFLRNFLVYYLDSDKGKEEYSYFENGFGFNNFNHDFIFIKIPLIDIEMQKKIIKAYELNEEHYKLVKESRDNFLTNILDYEKVLKDMENFNKMEIDTNEGQIVEMNTVKRHMFDGLLWPLSISYLNAVHGTHVNNPNEKLDFYLKLFEFLTAFIDIVLISAIPSEEYGDLKEGLWDGISGNTKYNAAFGTWTTLYNKLLELYAGRDIVSKFNNELIESLLNKDIYEIMDEARLIRNEFTGHGVSITESRAKQLIDELKLKIDVVYDIFGYLNGFKLFYSVKVLELFEDGSNLYEVISLNGPCNQPIYGKVTFHKRLKNNSLYLNNSLDGDLLELNPNLIKFEEVIEEYVDKRGQKKERATGRFYLYLFNGFKKRNNKFQVRYKCYQIETDEISQNISFDEWGELM